MKTRVGWLQFTVVCITLILVAFLQHAPTLSWFGVRPNIPFALLVAVAFLVTDTFVYIGLCLLAISLIGPTPGLSLEKGIFATLLIAIFFLRERLPFGPLSGIICVSMGATILFYIILDAGFLKLDGIAVFYEMIYNAVLAVGFYVSLRRLFSHGKTPTTLF